MTYLVAAIEHHARKLANAVTRAVVEKCSGYSAYEAGDFLTDAERERWIMQPADRSTMKTVTVPVTLKSPLVEREAGDHRGYYGSPTCEKVCETDLAGFAHGCYNDPGHDDQHRCLCGHFWVDAPPEPLPCAAHLQGCPCVLADGDHAGGWHCCEHGARFARPKTPVAGQRGESSPTASEPPELAVGLSDPSRVTVGAVRGEGSPADSDIPSSPAGERPTWVDWAVPAICDVLAVHVPFEHLDGKVTCIGNPAAPCPHFLEFADPQDWRDHVAPLIADRLGAAMESDALRSASETFPQFRTTPK